MMTAGHVRIFTGMLLTGLALILPSPAGAIPGDPDFSFASSGIATVPATTSSDIAYGAGGVGLSYVTGEAYRGHASHLFISRFQFDGTLDPTFGSAGRSMLRLDNSSVGRMVRQQPDLKLLVVGTHYIRDQQYEILVARFNVDGSIDPTFGTNGIYTNRVGLGSRGSAVSIQADGKILVAGATEFTGDMVILRLNADGSPDATFGTGGLKTLDFRGGTDRATGVIPVAAGKILVIGTAQSSPTGENDYAIARLNTDGSVDATFGPAAQNGLVLIDVTGAYDVAETMLVDADGIWLGGTSLRSSDFQYVFSLAKLTLDGMLDTTFGGAGTALVSPGPGHAYGKSIARLAPGGPLIGGSGPSGRFAMARFNTNGTLDASFGSGGVLVDADPGYDGMVAVEYDSGGIVAVGTAPEVGVAYSQDIMRARYDRTGATGAPGSRRLTNLFNLSWNVRAITLTPGGKIVIAGWLYDTFDSDFAALRINADGTRDFFFGEGLATTVGFGKGDDFANAMLARPDGKLVLGGRSNILGTSSFALTRLFEIGVLDTTFGTAGRTTHTMGIGSAYIHALAAAPGGKIIAAGQALVASGNDDFALARYTSNGLLDSTFGSGGVVITPFGVEPDVAQAVAVQLDGKIVAAGYTRSSNLYDFAVARYNADGTLDAGFGTGGKVTIPVGANNDLGHALALLPNGKILVAGEVFNSGTNSDMAVVRLNANGGVDTTFGTAGIAIVNFASGADAAWAMAVQPNDKIVLAGTAFDGVARGFALARLNADGSTDTGFGSGYAAGGRATRDITGSVDTAFALALRRDGRIISAGVAGSQWAVTRSLGDTRPVLTLTDLNADGKSDFLYRNISTGNVYRMVMGGFTVHHGATAYTEPNTAWKVVGDADFNGDGFSDLLYRNDTTGQVALVPFEVNGLSAVPVIFYTEPNAAWKIVHTPDLDGDGRADILWWNSTTGQVYAMLMNGSAIVGQGFMYTEPDTAWKIVAVGDMAGSGKVNQLVWRHGTTGQVYLMTITVAGSTFSYSGLQIYLEPNTAWKIVAAADFNGDGKSDLLWRNSTNGQIYVMLMNGSTIQSQGLMYVEPNLAWKIVAQGDYNGDGKADLLWRNETTGAVYMMLINGLAIASQAMVYVEPNTAWKLLGPWEYGQATGIISGALTAKDMPSTFDGPLLNASPGISGTPLNRSLDLTGPYRP